MDIPSAMRQVSCLLLHRLKKEDTTPTGQSKKGGTLRPKVALMQPEGRNSASSDSSIQWLGYLLSSNDTKTRSTKPQKQPTLSGVTKKISSGVTSRIPKGYLGLSRKR